MKWDKFLMAIGLLLTILTGPVRADDPIQLNIDLLDNCFEMQSKSEMWQWFPAGTYTLESTGAGNNAIVVYYSGSNGYGESIAVHGGIPETISTTGEILAAFWPDTFCSDNSGTRTLTITPATSVYDTGFQPSIDGFLFRNDGPCVEIGSLSKCIWGYCLGMTYASLDYWFLDKDPIQDTSIPSELNPQWRYINWLQTKYFLDSGMQNILWSLFNDWAGISINYEAIKSYIDRTHMPVPIFLAGSGGGGHAVLVYKIDDKPNTKILHIYDSNRPPSIYSDPSITINVNNSYWEMEPYSLHEYTRFAMLRPAFNIIDLPLAMILHSPVSMVISDPEGNIISQNINEIEGARYWREDINDDGEEEQIVALAAPKDGQYSITIVPDPGADQNDIYSLQLFNYGKETFLAESINISEIPMGPYIYNAHSMAAIGDLNGDGCVDRNDYNIIMADIRDREPNNFFYDLNDDGVVNIADARYLATLFTNPRGATCE